MVGRVRAVQALEYMRLVNEDRDKPGHDSKVCSSPLEAFFFYDSLSLSYISGRDIMLRAGLIAGLACVALVGCNTTGINKTFVSGKTSKLEFYYTLNVDCSSIGDATVRIISGPSNGSISIVKGSGYSRFTQDNQRYVCNARPSQGVNVMYTPRSGFSGSDSVTLEVIFASGSSRTLTYNVVVK